jgi:lytic murein transglycosylase
VWLLQLWAGTSKGRLLVSSMDPDLNRVKKAYGVDRHFIVAIWGIESDYGKDIGERSVLRSTATLACIGRRQDYFRDEFLSALEILARGDVRPEHLKGSWAGAFGPTQFMPTSFKRFAVDFGGDGRRDVVDSVPDLIASTANNLKKDGWVSAQTWGYEVVLPRGFDFLLVDRARAMTIREWPRRGIARANGKPFPRSEDRAYLLLPAGAGSGISHAAELRVIMKYNPAEAYALAIAIWPTACAEASRSSSHGPGQERVLSRAERYELQQLLAQRGYDIGEPDGHLGGKTHNALRQFQASAGYAPDGFASASLLERLRAR